MFPAVLAVLYGILAVGHATAYGFGSYGPQVAPADSFVLVLPAWETTLVGRSYGCSHIWFTGQPMLLQLIQQTLFGQRDLGSGDAVCLLYTVL